jgi:hypothetical protein
VFRYWRGCWRRRASDYSARWSRGSDQALSSIPRPVVPCADQKWCEMRRHMRPVIAWCSRRQWSLDLHRDEPLKARVRREWSVTPSATRKLRPGSSRERLRLPGRRGWRAGCAVGGLLWGPGRRRFGDGAAVTRTALMTPSNRSAAPASPSSAARASCQGASAPRKRFAVAARSTISLVAVRKSNLSSAVLTTSVRRSVPERRSSQVGLRWCARARGAGPGSGCARRGSRSCWPGPSFSC